MATDDAAQRPVPEGDLSHVLCPCRRTGRDITRFRACPKQQQAERVFAALPAREHVTIA